MTPLDKLIKLYPFNIYMKDNDSEVLSKNIDDAHNFINHIDNIDKKLKIKRTTLDDIDYLFQEMEINDNEIFNMYIVYNSIYESKYKNIYNIDWANTYYCSNLDIKQKLINYFNNHNLQIKNIDHVVNQCKLKNEITLVKSDFIETSHIDFLEIDFYFPTDLEIITQKMINIQKTYNLYHYINNNIINSILVKKYIPKNILYLWIDIVYNSNEDDFTKCEQIKKEFCKYTKIYLKSSFIMAI